MDKEGNDETNERPESVQNHEDNAQLYSKIVRINRRKIITNSIGLKERSTQGVVMT